MWFPSATLDERRASEEFESDVLSRGSVRGWVTGCDAHRRRHRAGVRRRLERPGALLARPGPHTYTHSHTHTHTRAHAHTWPRFHCAIFATVDVQIYMTGPIQTIQMFKTFHTLTPLAGPNYADSKLHSDHLSLKRLPLCWAVELRSCWSCAAC